MNGFIRAILVLTVSIQIACTGSTNLPPVYSGQDHINVVERQPLDLKLDFIDPEGQPITLSVNGADKDLFVLSATGILSFLKRPDYQYPLDANKDNRYQLTIAASDGVNQTLQNIQIDIIDVTGRVVIRSSRLFKDSDGNFLPNNAITVNADENGFFTLNNLDNDDIVVSIGGVDITTDIDVGNLVLAGFSRADKEFTLTPLGTMLATVGIDDIADAELLLRAFGLATDLSVDEIMVMDPWALAEHGHANGDVLLRINQQLLNLMLTLQSLAREQTVQAAVANNQSLAGALLAYARQQDGLGIMLNNAEFITALITKVASEIGSSIAQDPQAIKAIADKLALLNAVLQNQSINPAGTIAKAINSVIQVELQDAVKQLSKVKEGINHNQFNQLADINELFSNLPIVTSIIYDSVHHRANVKAVDINSFETAARLTNPAILSGYINTLVQGGANTSRDDTHENHIYQIEASGGEIVNLMLPASYPVDLDLYIYNSALELVDYSIGDSRSESIQLPTNADTYFINIRAFGTGESNYQLTVDDSKRLPGRGWTAAQSNFVIGDIIIQQLNASQGISDLLGQHSSSMSWMSDSSITSIYHLDTAVAYDGDSMIIKQPKSVLELKAATLRKIKRIAKDPRLGYAEPNFIRQSMAPTIDQHDQPWHFDNTNLNEALTLLQVSPLESVKVAVIDTGINAGGSYLKNLISEQYDFISDISNSGDGDGIDSYGADPGNGQDNTECPGSDNIISSFHGTAVADIIGLHRDSYNSGAEISLPIAIMNLRVLGCKGGYDFDIANAIRYAAGLDNSTGQITHKPADIINISLGGDGYSETLRQAIAAAREQNIITIAAAGNSSSSERFYPAAYDGVISVAATNRQGELASYSNYGVTTDISAPGGGGNDGIGAISSRITEDGIERTTRKFHGTSMAAAHMTAVTALKKITFSDLTPLKLEELIASGNISNDLGSIGWDDRFGYGQIDAIQAVATAQRLAGLASSPTFDDDLDDTPEHISDSINADNNDGIDNVDSDANAEDASHSINESDDTNTVHDVDNNAEDASKDKVKSDDEVSEDNEGANTEAASESNNESDSSDIPDEGDPNAEGTSEDDDTNNDQDKADNADKHTEDAIEDNSQADNIEIKDFGFVIKGANSRDKSGFSVSGVGDINNDGHDDLIIGAPGVSKNKGTAYVLHSKHQSSDFKISNINLKTGHIPERESFEIKSFNIPNGVQYGYSVSGAGNIDGDDYDDLIVGMPNFLASNSTIKKSSASAVMRGNSGLIRKEYGFEIYSTKETEHNGRSVSGAGDINNDGYDDVILSTKRYVYVLFGKFYGQEYGKNYPTKDVDLDNSLCEFSLVGRRSDISCDDNGQLIGFAIEFDAEIKGVSGIGDINADGFDDVIINVGEVAYIVFGSDEVFSSTKRFSESFDDAINDGLVVAIEPFNSKSISAVSGAGDVNQDQFDDVIIGVSSADGEAGKSYILYGKKHDKFPSKISLTHSDITINGASGEKSGFSVSGAGDVNCDGVDDIVIGAPNATTGASNTGAGYVVYGQKVNPETIELSDFKGWHHAGFKVEGAADGDQFGYSVSDAGDINSDGCDDVIIGAPYADSRGLIDSGASYVIYGHYDRYETISSKQLAYSGDIDVGFTRIIDNDKYILRFDAESIFDVMHGSKQISSIKNTEVINLNGTGSQLKLRPTDVSGINSTNTLQVDGRDNDVLMLFNHPHNSSAWTKEESSKTYKNGASIVEVIGDIEVIMAPEVTVTAGYLYPELLELDGDKNYIVVAGYMLSDKDSEVSLSADGATSYYTLEQDDTSELKYSLLPDGTSFASNTFDGYIYLNKAKFNNQVENKPDLKPFTLTVTHPDITDGPENSVSAEPLIMNMVSVNKKFKNSIERNPALVKFNESHKDGHYLQLDNEIFHGLTEFTIQIDFELDFSRSKNTKEAFLLSLATNWPKLRDNMFSIYLKNNKNKKGSNNASEDPAWDLEISMEDQKGTEYKIFRDEAFIIEQERVTLTVGVDLSTSKSLQAVNREVAVFEDGAEVGNDEKSSMIVSNFPYLEVAAKGAVFGNDQDKVGGKFSKKQAFEGNLYEIRVYDQKLAPTDPAFQEHLLYSVSRENILFPK